MIRILVIDSPQIDGVSFWRSVKPLTELQRAYPNISCDFVGENVDLRKLMAADLIIMFRPIRPRSLEFLKKLKNPIFKAKIILDIDDNLWRIPPGHPNEIDFAEYADTLQQIYSLADGIWCSTDPLIDFTDARDGRGVVVPNAVMARDLPEKPIDYRGIVCWRGSISNRMDIDSAEAEAVFTENRERFNRWVFWGYAPLNMRGEDVAWKGSVEAVEYMGSLPNIGINIMWKPLQENEFNDAKSNIAWIEATMAGGVCVSNYAGKPGWEMALEKFSDNPDFIAHQWRISKEWILKHYNLEKVNELRYQHIIKTLGG